MEKPREHELRGLSADFVIPVIFDNFVVLIVGLMFSNCISTISESALAATGMANTVLAVVFAMFATIITGASVVVSHQSGERNWSGASRTIHTTIALTLYSSLFLTALLIVFSQPLLRLLMPTAEDGLFSESLRYFRVLMISLPLYVGHSVIAGICRSMGDTRRPMRASIIMNLSQLLFAWLFIRVFHMEELGAAVTYICCRVVGTVLMVLALCHNRHGITLSLPEMLRVRGRGQIIARIVRIGTPVSVSNTFVQVGYLLINAIAIALGTFESGVYQILSTVNTLVACPQGICSTIALPLVGNLLGAGRVKEAKHSGLVVWFAGIGAGILLGLFTCRRAEWICGFFSANAAMTAESARIVWILLVMDIAGIAINAMDPQLQAGGDVKFVMIYTLAAVWLVRLPLSWLFVYRLGYGVLGLYAANTISLYLRAAIGLVRHAGSRWYRNRV